MIPNRKWSRDRNDPQNGPQVQDLNFNKNVKQTLF